MFQPVNPKTPFPEIEERILEFWKERDIFRKTIDERPEAPSFVFYEGPPTANARPGVHHVLSRAFKDLFPRYKTMRGYRVSRKAGWDTHGLPVELEVERELGIGSKPEIEEFGVEQFNSRCRESVMRYVEEWERLTERIAFWMDLEDAYFTYDNSYIESVWWVVKKLWDKGLVYLDYRSTPHCPRCETSLSDAEVALGYAEDTPDPSVYVKFPLTEESRLRLASSVPEETSISLLAWTTTPWTLPGNVALAVQSSAKYVVAEVGGELVVVASDLVSTALTVAHRVLKELNGGELVGLQYAPPYRPSEWGVQLLRFNEEGRLVDVESTRSVPSAHTVVSADFVSMDDGTGIVHIAPAFGGEDFDLGRELGLLFVQPVDVKGELVGGPFQGRFVKDADGSIMDDLAERSLLLRRGEITHTYPFCWRCSRPLIYYAKPTWYVRTKSLKDKLVKENQQINWYPEHIKHGRFGDWLNHNVDWALSRERYWGTPLPVWKCSDCSAYDCIGSVAELRERAVAGADTAFEDLHRPYIDRVAIACGQCDGSMQRLPDVMDAWLDSGAMPYAQHHYPFEGHEAFRDSFPADFICEAVDQTRGWFYSLHAESTLLSEAAPAEVPGAISYRNVICLGHILDEDGRKMSKSLGNVVDPRSIIDVHGADALRWYLYTASPPGQPRRFSADLVGESLRRFLLTLRNVHSFFNTYAIIDGFDPRLVEEHEREEGVAGSELDRWICSELSALVERVTHSLEEYEPTAAGRSIQTFVEILSNWYLRRSRRRFWKTANDADKLAAYRTLYDCLVTTARLLAPFTPFIAEEMYQNLVRPWFPDEPESIHLADWPEPMKAVDEGLMNDMQVVMRVVSVGRAARSKAGIKVRQPLASAVVKLRTAAEEEGLRRLASQVVEELNVKELVLSEDRGVWDELVVAEDEGGYAVGLDLNITPDLANEGLAREFVHRLQNLRRVAGLNIMDQIEVYCQEAGWLRQVVEGHGQYIRTETLCRSIVWDALPVDAYQGTIKMGRHEVVLAVKKVG